MEQKSLLEQQINVIQSEINNIDPQIAKYDELISQKEDELAQLEQQEAEQYQLFCERVRYMEEEGEVSYWAILFNAEDFSDMLDRFMICLLYTSVPHCPAHSGGGRGDPGPSADRGPDAVQISEPGVSGGLDVYKRQPARQVVGKGQDAEDVLDQSVRLRHLAGPHSAAGQPARGGGDDLPPIAA